MLLPQRDPGRALLPTRFDSLLRLYSVDLWRIGKTLEFIGYQVDRDEPEEGTDNYNILYQDLRTGQLHYCYGCENERGDWDAWVDVDCADRACGWTLEAIRAEFRNRYGSVPSFLGPPEIEDMGTVTGYDS
jgi:hypothetical protein